MAKISSMRAEFRAQMERHRLLRTIQIQQCSIAAKDEFISLMGPYISIQESHYDTLAEPMRNLVDAYRRAINQ